MAAYLSALLVCLKPLNLLLIFAMVSLGIVFGAIPGLSATLGIALLLPITFGLSTETSFVMLLAIWIGGVVLCALVKANPSEKCMGLLGLKPGQAYLGRLVFFVVLALMQSTLILLGDLYFLQVQCANPLLFLLAGWAASFVFVNIIYALTASFGDVGKAVAVLLMVIQVAGSGGSFPVQMLPGGFQAVYPFLPFVHSENAMRAAMFGLYGNDFWVELGLLLSYVVV